VSAVTRRRLAIVALLAAVTVAARLPFLSRADRFFDSDEAVEGLMARHILGGELPLVLWGQQYKGVPEVYLNAAVFAAVGSSVTALKATSLACFVLLVCLQFALVDRLFSRRVAWLSALLLAAGPPSLVLWSLSGNAEIVMTMIAAAVLLLSWLTWRATGSRGALAAAAAAVGFGLWVHQYIVYYVVALALAEWWRLPDRWRVSADFLSAREGPAWVRWSLRACLAVAALYVVLGLVAFFFGGFDLRLGQQTVTVHHPQKMWQIAAALVLLGLGARWLTSPTRSGATRRMAGAGFLLGYSPALLQQIRAAGSAPIADMTFGELAHAWPEIAGTALPIVLGLRSPTTEPLPGWPWMAVVLGAALLVAYGSVRRTPTLFFHVFVVSTAVMFVASGSYIDAQSYRYLMPLQTALPVLYAIAVTAVWNRSRWGGVAAAATLIAVFVWQQTAWFQRLEPDRHTALLLRCAEERSIRYARATYWTAYKITFLTDENVIVAPTDGVDRYPSYTAAVDRQAPAVVFQAPPSAEAATCDDVIGLVR
jgi:hypothetical protein